MNKKYLFSFLLLAVIFLPLVANAASPALDALATSVKGAAISVGAILAVIGFVVAGILWLTSGGSPEKTGLARKALIAAIIGTIILVIAGATSDFVKIIKEVLNIP